jgi:hypothetical protein
MELGKDPVAGGLCGPGHTYYSGGMAAGGVGYDIQYHLAHG